MARRKRQRKRTDLATVFRRNIAADGWLSKYRAAMQRELAKQLFDVLNAVRRGEGPRTWGKRLRAKWERGMRNAKREMVLDMAVDGYMLGAKEFDNYAQRPKAKTLAQQLGFEAKQVEVAIAEEELRNTRLRADVERYITETSKLETATSIKRYGRYHQIAIDTGMSLKDMARLIRLKGLAATRTRAELMARTTTIWAYNEGAAQLYKDEGVRAMEWIATIDELTDEACADADGEQQPMGHSFSTGVVHPPAHGNCRCAVSPIVVTSQVKQ